MPWVLGVVAALVVLGPALTPGHLLEAHHPLLVVELEERHGGIAPSVDFLRDLGYRAQILVDKRWVPLDGFDLVAHQAAHGATAE